MSLFPTTLSPFLSLLKPNIIMTFSTSINHEIHDKNQPGGGIPQSFDRRNVSAPPPHVRNNQLNGFTSGYLDQIIRDGIPYRPHGLFPPNDPLLKSLSTIERCKPFEKHLPGEDSPYQLLPKGGWATGDTACRNGLDLRLFYQFPPPPSLEEEDSCVSMDEEGKEQHQYDISNTAAAATTNGGGSDDDPSSTRKGRVLGAVRLGDGACIGNGFYMSAHGGSIESILDEATAELAKIEMVPMVSTVEAHFKIKKPVPLHTSLKVECWVEKKRGIRCWVGGRLMSADEKVVYAVCEAVLCDMTAWI